MCSETKQRSEQQEIVHGQQFATASPRCQPHRVERLLYLDGIRGIAGLYIVLHHALLQFPSLRYSILMHGHMAVNVFIVLSGFCLMLSSLKKGQGLGGSYLQFIVHRATRLLPPYYAGLVFSYLLIVFFIGNTTGTHWDVSLPVTSEAIRTHLLLVHNLTQYSAKINHAYWSIATEWQLYFLFPLILILWRKVGGLLTAIISINISVVLYFLTINTTFARGFPHYLALFTLGAVASATIFTLPKELSRKNRIGGVALLVFMGFISVMVLYSLKDWYQYPSLIFSDIAFGFLFIGAVGVVTIYPIPWVNRILENPILLFLGRISYSMYLVHAPLLQLIQQHFLSSLHLPTSVLFIFLVLISIPFIVAISYLFYLIFEEPWTRFRPVFFGISSLVPSKNHDRQAGGEEIPASSGCSYTGNA